MLSETDRIINISILEGKLTSIINFKQKNNVKIMLLQIKLNLFVE